LTATDLLLLFTTFACNKATGFVDKQS